MSRRKRQITRAGNDPGEVRDRQSGPIGGLTRFARRVARNRLVVARLARNPSV
jgi:hypothetical protein